MKLLFIEDEPESVEPAIRWLRDGGLEFDDEIQGFGEADAAIARFGPDIVVLDLLQAGSAEGLELSGAAAYNVIWDLRFCPIVVFSAQPDLLKDRHPPHPFVKFVQKGSNAASELATAIGDFKPHVDALHEAERSMHREFSVAMRDVAPYVFGDIADPQARREAIVRAGRRRLAALMDQLGPQNDPLRSWEQYLFPAIGADVLLGDILRLRTGEVSDPRSFRIVLTPSCDMVASGGRLPRAERLLIAKCVPYDQALKLIGLGEAATSKLKDKLPGQLLRPGFHEAVLPLPALEGQIPPMAANLRALDLIQSGDVGEGAAYVRAASIDSPFREVVSWAYLQTGCRPGVPDRDIARWCDEIVASLGPPKTEGS